MKALARVLAVGSFAAVVVWLIANEEPSAAGARAGAAAAGRGAAAWRTAPLWDDGRAEFSAYEVEWAGGGQRLTGRAFLVLAKEAVAGDLDLRDEPLRHGSSDLLKLSHVRDLAAGIDSYHQVADLYLRRDDGALRRLVASSSRAGGIATAEMRGGRLDLRSTFERGSERSLEVSPTVLPEDGLPAILRDWTEGALPAKIEVLPSLMSDGLVDPKPVRYRLARTTRDLTVPAGAYQAIEIRLESGSGALVFDFDAALPHVLLRLARQDGSEYRLAKTERIAYWERRHPGDEAWLPTAVR